MEQTNQKIVKALRFSLSLNTLKKIKDKILRIVKYSIFYLVASLSSIEQGACDKSMLDHLIAPILAAVVMIPLFYLIYRNDGTLDDSQKARKDAEKHFYASATLRWAVKCFCLSIFSSNAQSCLVLPVVYRTDWLFSTVIFIDAILPFVLYICVKYCLRKIHFIRALKKQHVYRYSLSSTSDIESQQMIKDHPNVLEIEKQNIFLRYLKRFIRNISMGNAFIPKYPINTDCTICLEEFENSDLIRALGCGHAYHKICIDPWLAKNSESAKCPSCKISIYKTKDEEASKSR